MPRSPFRSFREVERNLTSEHTANIHLLLSDMEIRFYAYKRFYKRYSTNVSTNVSMHRKSFIHAFGNHRCLTSYVEINRERAEMAKTMAFFLNGRKIGIILYITSPNSEGCATCAFRLEQRSPPSLTPTEKKRERIASNPYLRTDACQMDQIPALY